MAFVFRSERVTQLGEKKGSELGPGEYLQPKISIKDKLNTAPFGVKSRRDNKSKDETPGPASYFTEKRYNNVCPDEYAEDEPLYKAIDTAYKETHEGVRIIDKKPFTFMERRFKENYKNDTPGPGYYHMEEQRPRSKDMQKVARKSYDANAVVSRVSSIPFKDNSYGYNLDGKGNLVINHSPDSAFCYKGEKNDKVGPDRYNTVKPKDWIKRSIDWSKSKSERCNVKKAEEQSTQQPLKEDITVIPFKKKYFKEKIVKDLVDRRKRILELQVNIPKPDLAEDIVSKETPGPGYYYSEDIFSSFKSKQKEPAYQSFGTFEQRFNNYKKLEESDEFVDNKKLIIDERYDQLRTKKLKEQVNFNSVFVKDMKRKRQNSASIEIKKESDWKEKLGPGTYELTQSKKPAYSNIAMFGSMEKRFVPNKVSNEKVPGPGSYFSQNDILSNKNHTLGKLFSNTLKKGKFKSEPIPNPILTTEKKEDVTPGVGTYSPEINTSLNYKILKNVYKYNNSDIPFQSKEIRFKDSRDLNTKVGPGLYHKDVVKGLPEKIIKPTHQSISFKDKLSEDLGPGSYDLGSYFEWNKKSYNILYV
jgi:hypothetical protein